LCLKDQKDWDDDRVVVGLDMSGAGTMTARLVLPEPHLWTKEEILWIVDALFSRDFVCR
jgi:hypothetical protein